MGFLDIKNVAFEDETLKLFASCAGFRYKGDGNAFPTVQPVKRQTGEGIPLVNGLGQLVGLECLRVHDGIQDDRRTSFE